MAALATIIVDDHALIREGLRAILERDPEIAIVGEAATGREAVKLAREMDPDIVLMDLAMPELNGIEATRLILAEPSKTRIIALSGHDEQYRIAEALRAGVRGFVLKKNVSRELRRAIKEVGAGRIHLSPEVAELAAKFGLGEPELAPTEPYRMLSGRERQILQLLAEGATAPDVAQRLSISVATVRTHRRNIMSKLDLHSIAELTRYAIREGISNVAP